MGVNGHFSCVASSIETCTITLTGVYNDNDVDASTTIENRLNTIAIAVTNGTLRFRPSSATPVSLCGENVQCTAGDDMEYMIFGWWKEEPASASGDYDFGLFAEAVVRTGASNEVPSGLTATYDGIAGGMYVEQDPNDPVDTHRQGEFTADASLKVVDGTVTGSIDDFVTTPTGGSAAPKTSARWLVRLSGTSATIENMAGVSTGTWYAQFVAPHANAAMGTDPPGVVGAFNTRIPDSVHIAGAFGAEKR